MYGRHGESPLPIVAASTPGDCFDMAFESIRLAVKYMTPVIYLSDGYLANGAEPWLIPDISKLPKIKVTHPTDPENFQPYSRDPETLARPWAIPGTKGLEHRLGGLEKAQTTGSVSYDPLNHDKMIRLRQEKINRMVQDIPPTRISGEAQGDVLLVGWGSTKGAITSAWERLRMEGMKVSCVHINYINPLPADLGDILQKFKTVICPEMNLGQLAHILRAKYLIDVKSITKVQGKPFKISELVDGVKKIVNQ